MGDPRNVAHAKKVTQEKHHKAAHQPQPGKKAQPSKKEQAVAEAAVKTTEAAKPEQKADPTQLEKSLAVLAKLREMEFHSRGNIEKLAELSLTIEEELKQKPFSEGIDAVYAAQNAFQSKILELIGAYEAECGRLSGSA